VRPLGYPSTLGRTRNPPQAVENRKIIGVSIRLKIALFSAGNGLAGIGNSLGEKADSLSCFQHGDCSASI
jgi:hypothetical protein